MVQWSTRDSPDLSAIAKIQAAAHRLRGSGALFGFPQLGTQAERIELMCEQITVAHDPVREELRAELRRAIEVLAQLVEAATVGR